MRKSAEAMRAFVESRTVTSQLAHGWSGDDWQEWCDLLFHARHAPAGYVRVPDKDRGDLGIEGYSVDGTGCMYQCYATEAVDVPTRYEKQRDKITIDLGKLKINTSGFARLLGAHRMSHWVLVVPLHDSKELVFHARSKEAQIRELKLPYLEADFTVIIQTDRQDFARERAQLDAAALAIVPPITALDDGQADEAVATFKVDGAEQVAVMDAKLRRAGLADTVTARDRLLRQLVDADNITAELRRDFPTTHEAVLTQQRIEERDILSERDFAGLHAGSIGEIRGRLQQRLHDAAPAIGADHASRLAHGALGRWLLECPLDFPEAK
jgi:hypothetical protein